MKHWLLFLFSFFLLLFFSSNAPQKAQAAINCQVNFPGIVSPNTVLTNSEIKVTMTTFKDGHVYFMQLGENRSKTEVDRTPEQTAKTGENLEFTISLNDSIVSPGEHIIIIADKTAGEAFNCLTVIYAPTDIICSLVPEEAVVEGEVLSFRFKNPDYKGKKLYYSFNWAEKDVEVVADAQGVVKIDKPAPKLSQLTVGVKGLISLSTKAGGTDSDTVCKRDFELEDGTDSIDTPAGCTIDDAASYPACASDVRSLCTNVSSRPIRDNETLYVQPLIRCPDGRTGAKCLNLGAQPGQCGNPAPTPYGKNCPICPPEQPSWHAETGRCGQMIPPPVPSGTSPWSTHVAEVAPRLIDCSSGYTCTPGDGCIGVPPTLVPTVPPYCSKFVKVDEEGNTLKDANGKAIEVSQQEVSTAGASIQYKCAEIRTAIGSLNVEDASAVVKTLFTIVLSLSGGVAIMLFIYSGYVLMTSAGNPEKVQGAKDTITSAIIGLVFIIFSIVILQVIGVDILALPGFGP